MIFPQVAVRSLVQQTTRAGRPGGQNDSLPWQGRFVRVPRSLCLAPCLHVPRCWQQIGLSWGQLITPCRVARFTQVHRFYNIQNCLSRRQMYGRSSSAFGEKKVGTCVATWSKTARCVFSTQLDTCKSKVKVKLSLNTPGRRMGDCWYRSTHS